MPESVDAEALQPVREGKLDVATFASSSSVRNLASLLGDDFARSTTQSSPASAPLRPTPRASSASSRHRALDAHHPRARRRVEGALHPGMTGRIRPLAIVVVRRPSDGAILAAPGSDNLANPRFYRPLGGEIEFGELAIDAARRELREEISAEITDVRLLGIVENRFTFMGARGHELVCDLRSLLRRPSYYDREVIDCDEGGAAFEAHWVPLSRFPPADRRCIRMSSWLC